MSFANPLVLLGLLALPLIVWLLRAMPPKPVRQVFGGMFFLERLATPKRKPVRTPPIILILRLLAFTCLLIGLAGPILGPEPEREAGDLTLVFGDGWDAAQRWQDRLDAAEAVMAETAGTITLITASDGEVQGSLPADEAPDLLRDLEPAPRLADWDAVFAALPEGSARRVLIAGGAAPFGEVSLAGLRGFMIDLPRGDTLALGEPRITADRLSVTLMRASGESFATYTVQALSEDGRIVSAEEVRMDAGQRRAEVTFRLPLALRNEVARLSIEGLRSAGTVTLLGSSAKRTAVGLVSSGSETLREGGFYIARALGETAAITEGSITEVLASNPDLLVLDDVGSLRADERAATESFVRGGGLLLRFAGPDLLAAELPRSDALMPAPLIGGERALGGALTWAKPQTVGAIDAESPLGGLSPSGDVSIKRQVLTEPGAGLQSWMTLADGTPLITARSEGEGLVALVHVSALPTWSDFPISGLFTQVMRRIASAAQSGALEPPRPGDEPLQAARLLTGRGQLVDPPYDAESYRPGEALPPPGLYGEGAGGVAVNTLNPGDELRALTADLLPRGTRITGERASERRDLSALFLAAALAFLIGEGLLTAGLGLRFARAAPAALVLLFVAAPLPADAQIRPPLSDQAVKAALELRFGYIKTGDTALDRISEAGLYGLSREATRRSSLEPAAPQAVDPDRDELSVYTLLYWPVRAGQAPPSDAALQRLEAFMNGGGMLIIDTGDGGTPGRSPVLPDILGRLDAPPLQRLGPDSVLLFSFYRLDDLYGRNPGGEVWVETAGALDQRRDGVPSLIISGRDWASAWALDKMGVPLRPAGPGGESRREYAFRSGINMAMVAITGNYKADQTEVTTMLEELGGEQP